MIAPGSTLFPRIVAHRGNAAEFPENTIPALRSALELGVTHVEFDVHLTADHVPIVLHDANLKRTAGIDRGRCRSTSKHSRACGWVSPNASVTASPTRRSLRSPTS